MSVCSWGFQPPESRKYFGRCPKGVLVLILVSTTRFQKLGRDSTGSVADKTSRAGARSVGPVRRLKDRCNQTTSVRLLEELQET